MVLLRLIEKALLGVLLITGFVIISPLIVISKVLRVGKCKTCGRELQYIGYYDKQYHCPHCDELDRFDIQDNYDYTRLHGILPECVHEYIKEYSEVFEEYLEVCRKCRSVK